MRKYLYSLLLLLFALRAEAQMPQKLPLDSQVRHGKLENGLTYFVMKNSEPKGQAEFYIAQKVGSILEEEEQRGLAHFLEHMAFNGTTHFPGNTLISYLESIGVRFGANLNAYTAVDQTVYNISAVPVEREGAIDSCLLILHDWSNELLLHEEEIDNERGVIREELRTRSNAQMRMLETLLPEIMGGSKYGHRLPGGLVEVIDSFTYQELRDYYEKWYRPDLQGIIVVGDIDPEAVEEKIKTLFSPIPLPADVAERVSFEVPNNKEPIVVIASDPEALSTNINLMFKKEPMAAEIRGTVPSLVFSYINTLVNSMLNTRFADIIQKSNSPFTRAGSSYGEFIVAQTKDAFSVSAIAKENGIELALTALVKELERMKRYGFTQSELDRAKANYSSAIERLYNEREKLKNNFFVEQLLNYFLTQDSFCGVECEYLLMKEIEPLVTLEEINRYATSLVTNENMVLALMMPEKEGVAIPTANQLLSTYSAAQIEEVEEYKEELSDAPLIETPPVAGSIVSQYEEPVSGAKVWYLSNGATVVALESDFKSDEILFSAKSKGGYSLIDPTYLATSKLLSNLISVGGVGNFSNSQLRKVLAGKSVSLKSSVGLYSEGIGGATTPKDIETFMQMLYLSFTSIREDREAFDSWLERAQVELQNSEANPMTTFKDSLQAALYGGSEYAKRVDHNMLQYVDYQKALELGRERFANAADFVFIFVGNIEQEQLKELVKSYIASLPSNRSEREDWAIVDYSYAQGKITKEFEREMQNPKSSVYSIYTGDMEYNVENRLLTTVTSQILDLLFTRTIREDEQGTYGVGVQMSLDLYPKEEFILLFGFDTDVNLKERLLKRAYTEIDKLVAEGVLESDFNKVIEYLNKTYTQNLRENRYWLSFLSNRYLFGKEMHSSYKESLDSITTDKLNSFIREIFSTKNHIEVIMNGVLPQEKR
ncbi:MAG: insulinase family protein [Bacteroidales bacterium]